MARASLSPKTVQLLRLGVVSARAPKQASAGESGGKPPHSKMGSVRGIARRNVRPRRRAVPFPRFDSDVNLRRCQTPSAQRHIGSLRLYWLCILDCRSEPMLPLHLQSESHIPLYVQLRDQLRSLVHSGELRTGDRIPASRELATQLGVHRTTVANAYAELESEGMIQGHVGRGTYICGAPAKQFTPPPRANGNGVGMRWESIFADDRGEDGLSRLTPDVPKDAIGFVAARPPEEYFPLEEFRSCCNAVLRSDGRKVLQIGSSDGYEPLKSALIDFFRDEGLSVRGEQLLITGGCQQAIDLF